MVDKVKTFAWQSIPGITFLSNAHYAPEEPVLGIGVNFATRHVTHLIEREKKFQQDEDPFEERKKTNKPFIGFAGRDSLVAVTLEVPVDLDEYGQTAPLSEDLKIALRKAQSNDPELGKPDLILSIVDEDRGTYINGGNCYSYAVLGTDKEASREETYSPVRWPGGSRPGGYVFSRGNITTSGDLQSSLEWDGLEKLPVNVVSGEAALPEKEGHYIIAAFFTPRDDFHFYRREPDGTWSHRINYVISDKDAAGEVIMEPLHANQISAHPYATFGGYYYVPNRGINIGIPTTGQHTQPPEFLAKGPELETSRQPE